MNTVTDRQITQWLEVHPQAVHDVFTAFLFEQATNPGCWVFKTAGGGTYDYIGRNGHVLLASDRLKKAHEYIPDYNTYDPLTQAELAVIWVRNEYSPGQLLQIVKTITIDLRFDRLFYSHYQKGTIPAKDFAPFKVLAQEFGPSQFRDLVIET